MAKMKQLLVDLAEYENEIEEVLTRIESVMPTSFQFLVDNKLLDENKKAFIDKFTNDERLTELVLVTLELRSNEMSEV